MSIQLPLGGVSVSMAYYLSRSFGFAQSIKPDDITVWWPFNAVILAAMLLSHPKKWWLIMLAIIPAKLAANIPAGISWQISLGFLAADYAEVLAASLLIRYFIKGIPKFDTLRNTMLYILCAAVIAPAVSAFPCSMFSAIEGFASDYALSWQAWYLRDFITHLTITPFIILFFTKELVFDGKKTVLRLAEALLLITALVLISIILFSGRINKPIFYPAAFSAPLLIFLWASARFGSFGVFAASIPFCVFAIRKATVGPGPFSDYSSTENIMFIQAFIFFSLFPSIILGSVIDERTDSEREIMESEENFRILVENLTDLIVKTDAEGKLLFISPSYTRMFGEGGLIGNPIQADHGIAGIDRDTFKSRACSGQSSYFEIQSMAKEGLKWIAWVNTPLFDAKGVLTAVICVGRDITEQKKSEEENRSLSERLMRARKMEAMGLLAGGVAHDLNNILSGIISIPEMMLQDFSGSDKDGEWLTVIRESGLRAAAVVQDLVMISRGISSKKEVTGINDIVDEFLQSPEFYVILSDYPRVNINKELAKVPLDIYGSPVHLKKALMNLVSNSFEALEGTGNIHISTALRVFEIPFMGYEVVEKGNYAVLSVANTGPKIPGSDLERIFEPFYTKKRKGKSGTGLGLAIVWNTVKEHDGFINIKSGDGGTGFEMFFPITDRHRDPAGSDEKKIDIRGSGERILMVDDEDLQRRITCHMLRNMGYRADSVPSGEEALDFIRGKGCHLVILDIIMHGGLDGFETYKRIIGINPGQKALIISGIIGTAELERLQEIGAGNYLRKPYTMQQLGEAVKKSLEGDGP